MALIYPVGVERAPGDKDLTKVAQLFEQLKARNSCEC
jgi:phosphoribosylanthranilate isomerase